MAFRSGLGKWLGAKGVSAAGVRDGNNTVGVV